MFVAALLFHSSPCFRGCDSPPLGPASAHPQLPGQFAQRTAGIQQDALRNLLSRETIWSAAAHHRSLRDVPGSVLAIPMLDLRIVLKLLKIFYW